MLSIFIKTFDFLPITGFLLFIILITGKTIILKRKGVAVGSNTKKSVFVKYIVYPIFLIVLFVFIYELLKPLINTPYSVLPKFFTQYIFNSVLIKVLGVIVITTSIIFLLFTLRDFNKSLRFGTDSKNLGELITTGVFKISRNPFFFSIILYFTGIAFIYPNLFFITLAALTVASIHIFILKEEEFLLKYYGSKYKTYTKNVNRYFEFASFIKSI